MFEITYTNIITNRESNDSKIVLTFPKESYIYGPLKSAFESNLPSLPLVYELSSPLPQQGKIFHYGEYEDIDHDLLNSHGSNLKYFANAYTYRKALIRKHYLSNTIHHYIAKNPSSALTKAWPESWYFELDYAEFLDDALDDVWELRCVLEENEQLISQGEKGRTFIMKPSMSDKGQGIRLFRTIDELQAVFDSFDEDPTDDEGEEDEVNEEVNIVKHDDNRIVIAQLRHFLVQEYISKPLLLKDYDDKKFHIRTYVLSKGKLNVWVYDRMLMLFSHESYNIPSTSELEGHPIDMSGHLTNTCLQTEKGVVDPLVVEFAESKLTCEQRKKILHQIHDVIGDVFKAAATVDRINFQPIENAFEVFGLDFLVNEDLSVSLLEVNAFPDFKQTGDELKGLIDELFDSVVKLTAVPWLCETVNENETLINNMTKVLAWQDGSK